jgi:hypothetical protein
MSTGRVHAVLAAIFAAAAILVRSAGCGGSDLCFGSILGLITIVPAAGYVVGLAVRWLGGRSSPLVVLDVVLASLGAAAALPTVLALDLRGMAAIGALLALPLMGAFLGVREVAPYPIERIGLGFLLVAFVVFLLTLPGGVLGAVVPVAVVLALVRASSRAQRRREAAVLDSALHDVDREE